jgi:hypothetical protein
VLNYRTVCLIKLPKCLCLVPTMTRYRRTSLAGTNMKGLVYYCIIVVFTVNLVMSFTHFANVFSSFLIDSQSLKV